MAGIYEWVEFDADKGDSWAFTSSCSFIVMNCCFFVFYIIANRISLDFRL